MNVNPLQSEMEFRAHRFRDLANTLRSAASAYDQAAEHLDQSNEPQSYVAYRQAREILETIVDDLPRPVLKTAVIHAEEKPSHDWGWVKYMIPVAILLVVLYFLVTSGTTGDLSKTWDTSRDIRDAVRYPK
jgi:hypothetical protein